ncbi:unnamed protein product [Parajaminaea phylloscopi]
MSSCVVMANHAETLERGGPAGTHLLVSKPKDARRPSHQSLQLDLEGLDLGGPPRRTPQERGPAERYRDASASALQSHSLDKSARQQSRNPAPKRQGPWPRQPSTPVEDSFVAHLRAECTDANEILPSSTILEGREVVRTGHMDVSSGGQSSDLSRPSSELPIPTFDVRPPSQQVLGGFASLGPASLPSFDGVDGAGMRYSHDTSLSSTRRLEPVGDGSLRWGGPASPLDSVWQSMTLAPCDAMRLLDLLSIEEMGKHSVNIGNHDDWEGAVLVSAGSVDSHDSASSSLSLISQAPSWMAARSTHGKCKWITSPVLSDDEDAAERSVIVSDRAYPTALDSSRKPPPAFSGLACFELRALRGTGAKDNATVILANPSTIRIKSGRSSFNAGAIRRNSRRADSFAGSTSSSATLMSSSRHQDAKPRLRRTRSRPAIKYGALDHFDELSMRDQELIHSLIDSGFIEPNAIASKSSATHRADDRRRRSIDDTQWPEPMVEASRMPLAPPDLLETPTFGDYSMLQHIRTPTEADNVLAERPTSLASDPPVSPSDCVGSTQLIARPLIAQTRSCGDEEALPRSPVTSREGSVQTSPTVSPTGHARRPRIKKQPSSFGGWLRKKMTGYPGSSKKADRADAGPFAPHLYHRRGSASDESVALNAGKSDRKKMMGGTSHRQAAKHRSVMIVSSDGQARQDVVSGPSHPTAGLPSDAVPSSPSRRRAAADATPTPSRQPHVLTCPDPLLGLEGVPESALTMLLPLGSPRERSEGNVRRYLRVAFVPFSCQRRHDHHACAAQCTQPPTLSSLNTVPQWYRRLGKTLGQDPSALASSGTGTDATAPSANATSGSSAGPEAFLFGAGPAPKPSELPTVAEAAFSDNRRSSSVEAFRVTAQVVSAPLPPSAQTTDEVGRAKGSRPPAVLPNVTPFPVILAVCFNGKSLDFLAEGWEALNLGSGPAEQPSDAMYGVADVIVAGCAAVMDL